MDTPIRSSDFGWVIEKIETLSVDEQMLLVEVIRQHASQQRHSQYSVEVAETRQTYQTGHTQRGAAQELQQEAGGKSIEIPLQLHIPNSVAQAIRLPEKFKERELLIELAVALYAQEALSFGKARELAGMSKYEFGQLLGRRELPRHYGTQELEDDLRYARGE